MSKSKRVKLRIYQMQTLIDYIIISGLQKVMIDRSTWTVPFKYMTEFHLGLKIGIWVPQRRFTNKEDWRYDLKSTVIASLQNRWSLDLSRTPVEHICVCEAPFAGHLSSDKRVTEHVPREANDFRPFLALQSHTAVLRAILLEIERGGTTKVENMEHTILDHVRSLKPRMQLASTREEPWSPISTSWITEDRPHWEMEWTAASHVSKLCSR